MTHGLLIAGGGQAAVSAAAEARARGYAGPIRIAGDEPWAPYQRPPLSKAYLLGAVPAAELPLKAERFYAEQRIEWLPATRIEAIEGPGRARTGTGTIRFDQLVIATGARARRLDVPGAGLDGVVSLRGRSDADGIASRLGEVASVVVIGGGYIGLEVAAALAGTGRRITVLEAAPRVLARVTGPEMSAFLAAEHARHGVAVHCGARVAAIEGEGRVRAVRTAAGERFAADLVLVAAGAVPNLELVAGLGIAGADGIEVGPSGESGLPGIFAAGDCARQFRPLAGAAMRFESVQNAIEQGRTVGAAIAGAVRPPAGVPWFWSDQFDLKLQMAGLPFGADARIVRGDPQTRRFSVFYLRGGVAVGVDSVNMPAEHMLARRLLARPAPLDAERLRDPAFDLREWLAGPIASAEAGGC